MGIIANVATALGLRRKAGYLNVGGSYDSGSLTTSRDGSSIVTGERAPTGGVIFGDGVPIDLIGGLSAAELYQTQPHLRTVVSFVARNGAQLGRHVFTKKANGDRERVDGPVSELLDRPNDYMTGYDLFMDLFTELGLYDFKLWVVALKNGKWVIDPIPSSWVVGKEMADTFRVERYKIQPPQGNTWYFVKAEDAVVFRGYGTNGGQFGSSAVLALKSTLQEQLSALEFRTQMWRRGGRVGMFLSRPKDAPVWSQEARDKFITMWTNFSGSGASAGKSPLLEDGMELKSVRFNAKEEQWLEAATLSLVTVAAAYHVPPAMVGVPGYNSFASVKEFRKMLYTETLGPSIAQVEDTLNNRLLPLIAAPKGQYVEFNIAEKLQGDFEEQATQLFQAVGGPYMLASEARAKMNLPFIPGTDVLLAPLNMGASGNNGPEADEPIDPQDDEEASEASKPPKARNLSRSSPVAPGAAKTAKPTATDALEADLKDFFDLQRRVTLNRIGQKDPAWWDQKKWDQELSSTLFPHLMTGSTGTARRVAGAKGLNPDDYSPARTEKFLKAVADSRANLVNATVRDHYEHALENGTDPATVYEDTASHAKSVAGTIATFIAGFAAVEMAKQLVPDKRPTKTWIGSGLANSRHADMDGETVPIDEPFSNGAMWPGDPVLGAEGVANCGCGVSIDYEKGA